MSVDYFLWSPSHKKSVMIGSNGLGGVQSHPGEKDVVEFVRWAIDNFVTDVVMVDEYRLYAAEDDENGDD